jgi:hypothetical protein
VLLPLDFIGKAGEGLLPGNEPGSIVSSAIGREVGENLVVVPEPLSAVLLGLGALGVARVVGDEGIAKSLSIHLDPACCRGPFPLSPVIDGLTFFKWIGIGLEFRRAGGGREGETWDPGLCGLFDVVC